MHYNGLISIAVYLKRVSCHYEFLFDSGSITVRRETNDSHNWGR